MPVPFQYLQKFSLLRPLSQEALLRLSTRVEERQFARREVVCSKEQTRLRLASCSTAVCRASTLMAGPSAFISWNRVIFH